MTSDICLSINIGDTVRCIQESTHGYGGVPGNHYRVVAKGDPHQTSLTISPDWSTIEHQGCLADRFVLVDLSERPAGHYWYRLLLSTPSDPQGKVVWHVGKNSHGRGVFLDSRDCPTSVDENRLLFMPLGAGWEWELDPIYEPPIPDLELPSRELSNPVVTGTPRPYCW